MSGNEVALDTNQAIAVLNSIGDVATWLPTFRSHYLPVTVLGELHYGALKSRRRAQNQQRVEQLSSQCKILVVTTETARVYAQVRLQLKRVGQPIPSNDLWVAALCIPLATADTHFEQVEQLTIFRD